MLKTCTKCNRVGCAAQWPGVICAELYRRAILRNNSSKCGSERWIKTVIVRATGSQWWEESFMLTWLGTLVLSEAEGDQEQKNKRGFTGSLWTPGCKPTAGTGHQLLSLDLCSGCSRSSPPPGSCISHLWSNLKVDLPAGEDIGSPFI